MKITWLFCFFCILILGKIDESRAFEFQGNLTEGGWIIGKVSPGSHLLLGNKPVKIAKEGLFFIGFGRDEPPLLQVTEITPKGAWRPHFLSIAQRSYARQSIQGLPAEMVEPSPEIEKRIIEEQNRVRAARNYFTDDRFFLEKFLWPVQGPISGVYGSSRILNGQERQPHYGIDIAAPEGTEIIAPAGGIIRLAEDLYLTGGTVILDHGFGVSSTFIHMRNYIVKAGQNIKQGELLGYVGKTGRATGAHLDWRINWGQIRLDPQFAVPPMKEPEGGWNLPISANPATD